MGEGSGDVKRLGPYKLLRKLGEGGMGAVYEAERMGDVLDGTMVQSILDLTDVPADYTAPIQPGQRVALKLLRPQLTSNKEFVERFWREAKIVTMLQHDSIVRGLDAGQADEAYYFAMEFVEGRSVGSLLELEGALPEATALEIVLQVARGLQYAYERELIHRDIKPDNIMLTPEGHAKLADFGLARSVAADATQLTAAGQIMGTPYYLAPEQARGETVDIRSDIYSLGATLYHMVTGHTPFEAPSAIALITKCLTEVPPLANEKNANVSEALSKIIAKMMAKEVSERYQTPSELIGALEPIAMPTDSPELSISFMSMGEVGNVKDLLQKAAGKEAKPSDELTMPGPAAPKKSTATQKKLESTAGILNDPLLSKLPTVNNCKKLGHVILLQKLGQGGMGAVYRGRHEILDIDVAVKVMLFPPTMSDDQQEMMKQRFIREARIAIQLEHPGIVRTFEIGIDQTTGLTYIVMEFVPGKSAADFVSEMKLRGEQMSEKQALNIIRQAAEALGSAHKMGVVHRDIKLGNLLIRESDAAVKIADMGLAKSLGGEDSMQMTRSDSALGTPAYMAPEQASSAKDVGPKSDIYALGASLFNLVTGKVPFEGSSLFEVLSKVVNQAPPSLAGQRPDLTANVDRIAQKAMAKRPEDRYETAQDLANDCARALEAIGAGSVVIANPKLFGVLDRRHLPLAIGSALGGLALIAFVIFLIASYEPAPPVELQKQDPVVIIQQQAAEQPKEDPDVAASRELLGEISTLQEERKLPEAMAKAKQGMEQYKEKASIGSLFSDKALAIRESMARAAMEEIAKLEEENKFDEAIKRAKEAQEVYGGTSLSGQFRRRISDIRESQARAELDAITKLQESGDLTTALGRANLAVEEFKDTAVVGAIRQEKSNIRQKMATEELEAIGALAELGKLDDAIKRAESGLRSYADTMMAGAFRDRIADLRDSVESKRLKAEEKLKQKMLKEKHDRLIVEGNTKLDVGDHLGALASYNMAMGTLDTPESREKIQAVRMAMAEEEMKATRFDKALEQLLEAAKLVESKNVTDHIKIAKKAIDAKRQLDQATDCFRRDDFDGAEQLLEVATSVDPGYLKEQTADLAKRIADKRTYRAAIAAAKEAREKRAWAEIAETTKRALATRPDDTEAAQLLKEADRHLAMKEEVANTVGMVFRYVPGGYFTMGSNAGDQDEKPVVTVVLDGFYIGKYEVTNAMFEQYQPSHNKRRTKVSKLDSTPAVNVSWQEADAFCKWLTTKTGLRHRLPTEAEWELAAKGLDNRPFPWGATPPDQGAKVANWGEGKSSKQWAADGFPYTAPVGSYADGASPFGCLDMAGNVWEWVNDWYAPYQPGARVLENPRGARSGMLKVIRGGGWYHNAVSMRTTNRASKKPSVQSDLIGFRVVMEVEK
jgi:serine/threonine protein kinase/formylglycine-generating enzyme required for sulfatase activity